MRVSEIDDTSETILAILAGNGGEADVGEIKDAIDNRLPNGKEIDYSSIHHRCSPNRDGVLYEEGLVEPAGTDPRGGGTRDATIYALVDGALTEVERRNDVDIRDARDAEEVIEALERVEETITRFDAHLDELEDRIEDLEDDVGGNETSINRLERVKLETDDLRQALSGWSESIDHAVSTSEKAEELAEANETSIEALEGDVEQIDEQRLPKVEQRVDEAYQNTKDNLDYIQQIWGTLNIADYLREETTLKEWLEENYRQKRF